MEKGGYCGHCLRHYTRKENFNKHFELKNVMGAKGTGYSSNICFNLPSSVPRIWEKSKESAKNAFQLAKKSKLYFKLSDESTSEAAVKRSIDTDENDENPKRAKDDPTEDIITEDFGDVEFEEDGPNHLVSPVNTGETEEIAQGNLEKIFSLLQSLQNSEAKNHSELIKRFDKLENQETSYKPETNESGATSSKVQSSKDPINVNMIEADKQFTESMLSLKHATSFKAIMDNPLVTDAFELRIVNTTDELEENDEIKELYCKGCSDKSLRGKQCKKQRVSSFLVKDPNYVASKSKSMEAWFSKLKYNLGRHIAHLTHHQLSTSYNMLKTTRYQTTESIRRLRLNIMYFIMKTNSAFTLYPILLAVLSRCGHEVGNKNSSRHAIPKILDLLGMCTLPNSAIFIFEAVDV